MIDSSVSKGSVNETERSSSKRCKFSRSEYTVSLQCLTELTYDANGNKNCKHAKLLPLGRLRLKIC